LNGRTLLLGVIEYPIGHSPDIRDAYIRAGGMDSAHVPSDLNQRRLSALKGAVKMRIVNRAAGRVGSGRVVPGSRMLLRQAVQGWWLCAGREPDVETMNDALV
jgi:shikimate 5-dehydrogenase